MIHSLELDASPPMQNQGSIGKEKELMALREAITLSFTTLTLSSASLTLECHFLISSTPCPSFSQYAQWPFSSSNISISFLTPGLLHVLVPLLEYVCSLKVFLVVMLFFLDLRSTVIPLG